MTHPGVKFVGHGRAAKMFCARCNTPYDGKSPHWDKTGNVPRHDCEAEKKAREAAKEGRP
jgi:hypothetical protein